MKFKIENTKNFQQVTNALQSVQKDLRDHKKNEKDLRSKLDDISEELADARVSFSMTEITRKQLDKVISKHEAAQQELIRHGKNKETLKSAVRKLKQRQQDVFDAKVQELRPKAQAECTKKLEKMMKTASEFQDAYTDAQQFIGRSHKQYGLPSFSVTFRTSFRHQGISPGVENFNSRLQEWINNNK